MTTRNKILVVTTPTVEGSTIKKYLKPVSAHVVGGTNIFSDVLASFSDFFGGRSDTYQKQLTSLYEEAIDRLKNAAQQLGANCIVGLTIDMDEISGKGKSMFMLTAIGTAIIIEENDAVQLSKQSDTVSLTNINVLRKKQNIIALAEKSMLTLTDEVWDFISAYQVHEVFSFLLIELERACARDVQVPETSAKITEQLTTYISSLPNDVKTSSLYNAIKSNSFPKANSKICQLIKNENLFDYENIWELLRSEEIETRNFGVRISTYDKPKYDVNDIIKLNEIANYLENNFIPNGVTTTSKGFLGKEKEVWSCQCGRSQNTETYCSLCYRDIYGFKQGDIKSIDAVIYIKQKVSFIKQLIETL